MQLYLTSVNVMKVGKKIKHIFKEIHFKRNKHNYLSSLKAYLVLLDLLQGTLNYPDPGQQSVATIIKISSPKTKTKTNPQ